MTLADDAFAEGPEDFRLDITSADVTVVTPSTVTTVLDDELGGLDLTLVDSYPSDGLYPGAEVTYTATLTHGGSALANVHLSDVASAELTVVPGSVSTSAGTVLSEQPLDIDLGNLTAPSTITVTYRASLGAFPASHAVSTQLMLTSDGLADVPSNDPATPVAGDATETPVSTVPAGFELIADGWVEGWLSTLDASFFDASSLDSFSATVDWGDGSPLDAPTVSATGDGGAFSATHRYAQNGTYAGQVCITDGAGATRCESQDFVVDNVAPRSGWLDFYNWTVEDLRSTHAASDWGILDGGHYVTQRSDSNPTALLAPFPALGARVSGTWSAWDDVGYMGFVLGYEPGESERADADYLIAVWKKNTAGNAR
ncbi:MAG: PKD domain-containing protein, partial [Acidobacteriota bacterium]